jgi:hypothetical protein
MKDKRMNIQLKQSEIEAALRLYVLSQGFNLTNKALTIDFTAGRKAGGLIADLIIEDNGVPGVADVEIPGHAIGDVGEVVGATGVAGETIKSEVGNPTAASEIPAASDAPAAAPVAEVATDTAVKTETAAEVVEVPAGEAKPVASLFG